MLYVLETVISGLLAGVMYSLVALGFVLIFKASGVFNFAQGVMALFAGLTLVGLMSGTVPFAHVDNAVQSIYVWSMVFLTIGLMLAFFLGVIRYIKKRQPERSLVWALIGSGVTAIVLYGVFISQGNIDWLTLSASAKGLPMWLSVILTIAIMVVIAIMVEWLILRHLVNQEHIILFMSTLGLAYVLEGGGDIIWGSDVKVLDLGLPQGAWDWLLDTHGLYIEKIEMVAAATAGLLVLVLAVFFQKTRIGRALRAVADDHQAALSVGISLRTIWVIVWSVAGVVALVAGVMWGAKSGIQFSLSLIALKALPVLILGGFESIPGAIVGGLIIGVGEKLAEVYAGPFIGGAIENWFAYMLALVFLLFRPQGLFGEKIIERV